MDGDIESSPQSVITSLDVSENKANFMHEDQKEAPEAPEFGIKLSPGIRLFHGRSSTEDIDIWPLPVAKRTVNGLGFYCTTDPAIANPYAKIDLRNESAARVYPLTPKEELTLFNGFIKDKGTFSKYLAEKIFDENDERKEKFLEEIRRLREMNKDGFVFSDNVLGVILSFVDEEKAKDLEEKKILENEVLKKVGYDGKGCEENGVMDDTILIFDPGKLETEFNAEQKAA